MNTLSKTIIVIAAVVIVVSAGLLASGALNQASTSGDKVNAVVTIAPQESMVKAIGGDHVSVTLMVPAGQDPHTYEPTSGQIGAVSDADIYFEVGSGVEFEVARMSALREVNPEMVLVNCSTNITLLEMGEGHGHEGEGQDHGATDPHVWLSPVNLKQMARNVHDGLVQVDPAHAEDYDRNLQEYESRMDTLHENISAELAEYEGMEFMVYHPAWTYFAHEYELTQMAIEQEGQEPGPAGIQAIIDQAREHGIHVIFVSPQIDSSSAQVIAEEIDGEVVITDPLPTDIETELLNLAREMADGFQKQG